MNKRLSSKEWELISSYLDDELNPRDKARVEERLNTRPEYKEAFEGLQRTRRILQKAPVRKVPRNFTLTSAMVQPVKVPRWTITMQWSSAVAALAAIFMFAYQLVPGLSTGAMRTATNQAAEESALSAMEMEAPVAVGAAETPNVIYWGGPPLPQVAFGKGGGGGCGAPGEMCGGAADTGPIGGGVDAVPTQFLQTPLPNPLPDLQTEPKITPAPTEPITGSGPIMGVRPTEEQGKQLPETVMDRALDAERDQTTAQQNNPWLLGAAGGLLALAMGVFIVSFIARRNALR